MVLRLAPDTHPSVGLVIICDLSPQVNHAILAVLELPEKSLVDTRVTVPALVLTTGKSVHVDDSVESFGRTGVDDPVKKAEPSRLDNRGVAAVHEVSIIDGDADTVETQGSKELGILDGEEVLQKLVHCEQ